MLAFLPNVVSNQLGVQYPITDSSGMFLNILGHIIHQIGWVYQFVPSLIYRVGKDQVYEIMDVISHKKLICMKCFLHISKRIAGLLSRSCLHHVNGGVYTIKVKKKQPLLASLVSSPRHQIKFNSSMHGFSSSSEKGKKRKKKEHIKIPFQA